jgi:hypothetical protein
MLSEHTLKQAVIHALDELPREKVVEVLDFVRFLKMQGVKDSATEVNAQESAGFILRTVPASHLDSLTGLVAWGGDAIVDAERLYDDHSQAHCY